MSRIQELEQILKEAKANYYLDQREISDAQFDRFEEELRSLDPDNEVLKSVGVEIKTSAWPVVVHERPMGSLHKTNTEEELSDWNVDNEGKNLCASDKLDGFSLSVTYKGGKVVLGATRGDGEKGEDITENVRLIKGVVQNLSTHRPIAVRGEAILLLDDYNKHFPRTVLPNGKVENANPRNCMAAIRRKSDNSACRHFTFIAYDYVFLDNGQPPDSRDGIFRALKEMGFLVPNYVVGDIGKVIETFREYAAVKRARLPYEIDGLVVEVDDQVFAKAKGLSSDRPRAARAHKFESLTGKSKLLRVEFQPGRTGVVTPVGKIEPVEIGGISIESPSLMNLREICRLGLGIGSVIEVERSNDVIPRVIGAKGGTPIQLPGGKGYQVRVKFDDGGEVRRHLVESLDCTFEAIGDLLGFDVTGASSIFLVTDEETEEGTVKRLDNFLKVLDVKGVGEQTLASLVASKKATTIPQMLELSQAEWAEHCSGDKVALKIVTEIKDKIRSTTLPKFIKSLGLNFFGEDTTERLEEAGYDSVKKILDIDMATLLTIPGIKEAKAEAVVKAIKEQRQLIEVVSSYVGIAKKVTKAAPTGHPLSDKKVCFTGVRLKGDEKVKFDNCGMEEASGVSKNTDILVCKDPSGKSNKLDKAKELGIQILSLEDFVKQL